ncbi:MAG: ATP-binding protein [Candidatus Kapaibacterium sp.]
MLGGNELVLADCDVDAANMHILLEPDFALSEEFHGGLLAEIDTDDCSACGECMDICEFDAIIHAGNGNFIVNKFDCEGCGYCSHICPDSAIRLKPRLSGYVYLSTTRAGSRMAHAKLATGAENSGKLVARVRKEARKIAEESNRHLVLTDGSPGIGCPVISSITGADYIIIVTEPTVSGLHDMKRVFELVRQFNINSGCIINKCDLNHKVSGQIINYLRENKIDLIASIPYDDSFTAAMTLTKTIIELGDSPISEIINNSWKKILDIINHQKANI